MSRSEKAPATLLLAALLAGAAAALAPLAALGCRALFTSEAPLPERSFAHAAHFRAIKDIRCVDCHKPVAAPETPREGAKGAPAPGKYLGLADWALCARCHGPARSPNLKPDVARFQRPRIVETFDHQGHAEHSPMECAACHTAVAASERASDRLTPSMETCWTCHVKVKTLAGESGARCALCHSATDYGAGGPEKSAVFRQVIEKDIPVAEVPAEVMPPAHARLLGPLWLGALGPDDVPPDHSEVFKRRTHGPRSQEPTAKCYACHESRRCDECHETMPPPSHTLRFDRSTHGRAATLRRENCVACHEADFCQACHEVAPPGHTPDFRRSGAHARSARANTRSCFACHDFGEDCARCHNR